MRMHVPRHRSLRRWERTEEPFFVDEERERRLESLFEADLEARTVSCNAATGFTVTLHTEAIRVLVLFAGLMC